MLLLLLLSKSTNFAAVAAAAAAGTLVCDIQVSIVANSEATHQLRTSVRVLLDGKYIVLICFLNS